MRAWLLSFGTILFFFSLCCVTVIKSWPNKPTNPQTKQHTEDINFKFNFLFDEKCKFNDYKECQNWNKTRTVFTFTFGPLSRYDISNDERVRSQRDDCYSGLDSRYFSKKI